MISIHLDLKKLHALALLAPTDDIRQYLNGVYIEADASGVRAAVTDGIQLGMMTGMEPAGMAPELAGAPISVILPMATIAKMKPIKHMAAVATVLLGETGWHSIRMIDGTMIPFTHPEGKFPDIRRVVPIGEPTNLHNPLDWARVATFTKVHIALGGEKRSAGCFPVAFRGRTAVIQFPKFPDFTGILMGPKAGEVGEPKAVTPWPTL
jgi:hypothetical protein